jgi:hypothetical protein
LDNNIISRLGRTTKKTIVFSIELPNETDHIMEYTSSIQIFFSNDQYQSIVDHPIHVKHPQSITVDIHSQSIRSVRVYLRHLCLSYIEVKAIVYQNSVTRLLICLSYSFFY